MDNLVSFVDSLLLSQRSTCGVRLPVLTAPGLLNDGDRGSMQHQERWADEMEALQAIYDLDMTCISEGAVQIQVRPRRVDSTSATSIHQEICKLNQLIDSADAHEAAKGKDDAAIGNCWGGEGSCKLYLAVACTDRYPDSLPLIELQNHGALPYQAEDELFDSLLCTAKSLLGFEMVYILVESATDFLTGYWEAKGQSQLQERLSAVSGNVEITEGMQQEIDTTVSWPEHRPSQFVGSVIEVLGSLPKHIGVLNVENVLRQDLAEKFEGKRQFLKKKHLRLSTVSQLSVQHCRLASCAFGDI
jgi:hypothetical protein